MARHLEDGRRAEALAACWLQQQGLSLIARNFRARGGELDLVMGDGTALVIVEVRYRARITPVHPAESIGHAKQRRIIHATLAFLAARRRWRHHPVRFDIIAMSGSLDGPHVEWLRNAFTVDDVAAGDRPAL